MCSTHFDGWDHFDGLEAWILCSDATDLPTRQSTVIQARGCYALERDGSFDDQMLLDVGLLGSGE
jgi:hypothetical protein